MTGDLDSPAAARLLRLVDARLQLREHSVRTDHIVIDLARAHRITATAMTVLHMARDTAQRRHVDLSLAGSITFTALPLPVRQALHRFPHYPTLDAALTAIDQAAIDQAAIDQHPAPSTENHCR